MNERIAQILAQMAGLEDELRTAVHEQESRMFFQIKGKRVEFERSVKEAHRKLKTNFFRWLVTDRPQNPIIGPIIYGMALPLLMLCEIVGRTEQYFCPIKHARKILGTHGRYNRFLDYGDADDYQARLEEFRVALGQRGER